MSQSALSTASVGENVCSNSKNVKKSWVLDLKKRKIRTFEH